MQQLRTRVQELEGLLSSSESKAADLEDKFLRAHAEIANTRRQAEKDSQQVAQQGVYRLMEALLPGLDALNETVARLTDADKEAPMGKGFSMAHGQVNRALQSSGLVEVTPAPGIPFDPQQHEAMSRVPSAQPRDSVARCLRGGYTFGGRVIRAAMVMVSDGSQAGAEAPAAAATPAPAPAPEPVAEAASEPEAAAEAAAEPESAPKPRAKRASAANTGAKKTTAAKKPAAGKAKRAPAKRTPRTKK